MRSTTTDLQGCYAYSGLPKRFLSAECPDVPELGSGLYLVGNTTGTNKTWAAVTIAKRLIDSTYKLDERTGIYRVASVRFTTTIGLLDAYKATFSDGVAMAESDVTKWFSNCDLLVIDDLGKEKASEWAVSRLFEIVNARYENELPIIVTTQYSKPELIERLGRNGETETAQAIVSRLCEICRTVRFDGPDRRTRGGGR